MHSLLQSIDHVKMLTLRNIVAIFFLFCVDFCCSFVHLSDLELAK